MCVCEYMGSWLSGWVSKRVRACTCLLCVLCLYVSLVCVVCASVCVDLAYTHVLVYMLVGHDCVWIRLCV